MLQVFEDDWIRSLHTRYGLLGRKAPAIYRLATVSEFEQNRTEIENWFSELSERSKDLIVSKIRNPRSFRQTYNELAVAALFMKWGACAEYEPKMANLTPDWLITFPSGEKAMVEVSSRLVNQQAELLKDLIERIREIQAPVGVHIELNVDLGPEPVFSSEKFNKQLARRISNWILNDGYIVGELRAFEVLTLRIIGENSKWKHVQTLGPTQSFWVNDRPVAESISEKVKKYRELAERERLPLVVAIVPSFDSGIGADNMTDILFGHEVVSIDRANLNFGRVGRRPDGLFRKLPQLSAVIGIWKFGLGKWNYDLYRNESALLPLSDKFLENGETRSSTPTDF